MAEAESKIQNPKSRIAPAELILQASARIPSRTNVAELLFLLAAAALLLWYRSLNFSAPLDPDEANYGFIGSRLLDGDRMYVDVWDQQPP